MRFFPAAFVLAGMVASALSFLAGCIAGRPDYFPSRPWSTTVMDGGRSERLYDTDNNGRPDYREQLSAEGRIVAIGYDEDGDGRFAEHIDLGSASPENRRLLIILDSIPFDLVQQQYEEGRLRLFHSPARVIAPFPVMTDMCLNEFFGTSPSIAVETEYCDSEGRHGGWTPYVREENSPWLDQVDQYVPYAQHAGIYLAPGSGFDYELRQIEVAFRSADEGDLIGYVVATSALGMQEGRGGLVSGLDRLERFCQAVVHRTRGKVEITAMSDHGLNLVAGKRAPLDTAMLLKGYVSSLTLITEKDMVAPTFGLVSCAAICTKQPAVLARELTEVEGVDFAAYLEENGDVTVVDADGSATISAGGGKYRYEVEAGDPLELLPVLAELRERNLVGADGFVADEAWFEATNDHWYPDAVHRLHRAFHDLTEQKPDVLVSLLDGYFWGSGFMQGFIAVTGAHGNLNRNCSNAFVLTTTGPLPPVMRMEDLKSELEKIEALRGGR